MATMEEIAEKAGVSQATVSRVINGHSGVSERKRKLVMEWVRKLDYQPNRTAQSLKNKKSYLIGIIIPEISNPYFSEIIEKVEIEAKNQGYNVIIANSNGNKQTEKNVISSMQSRQIDGLLIAPIDKDSSHIKNLIKKNVFVVMLTQHLNGFSSVSVSHFNGGFKVAEHFNDLGHQSIAFIGNENDPKFKGFKKGLSKNGLKFDNNNLIEVKSWGGQMSSHEVYNSLNNFIKSKSRIDITGIFAYNDLAAFGAMNALVDNGLKIPNDIAVVGFDNTFIAQELRPTLTSVAQPTGEIGRLSVEILLKKIEGKLVEDKEVILESRLIVRESTRKLE
ncbi:LacI family transcriptional regulator [Halanaerobium saccharolyticum]|uniref:LacI family transcriptional regulator n=1 Tax=Halanaerobium saccharolyticum TaxID=43595 RepID=A0A4V3G3M5_9FIRM|nr:LacI family DNA-binding transcriptional regulator [Halanaerobium saccharolyticum]RAK03945.1 LacI family transcriptional regulator [Halanaerobium saccharolyticum]TDV97087.1 LacI family transcriptional regulator [Halanaerobium saccharolyticum]TDX48935.1 LacI family transcriptional regulator [Halanaerobium saccharolyticum]